MDRKIGLIRCSVVASSDRAGEGLLLKMNCHNVVFDANSLSTSELASCDRASKRLLLRVNGSDVAVDGFLPSTLVLASSDRTSDHRLLVNCCYMFLHGTFTREALVTSTPAAGDGVALEVHLSDVCISVCLHRELGVTQVASKRSFA